MWWIIKKATRIRSAFVFRMVICLAVATLGTPTVTTQKEKSLRTAGRITEGYDYQTDIDRLIALRSHPLEELIGVASQMENKWRRVNWNSYAGIMEHVCSELSNRGWNNERARQQSEHFATIALSHSNMYSWEHESMLVEWLAYQRTTSNVDDYLVNVKRRLNFGFTLGDDSKVKLIRTSISMTEKICQRGELCRRSRRVYRRGRRRQQLRIQNCARSTRQQSRLTKQRLRRSANRCRCFCTARLLRRAQNAGLFRHIPSRQPETRNSSDI